MQLRFDGAADQARPLAENRDGNFIGLRVGVEKLLFREAAVIPEGLELKSIDFSALRGEGAGYRMGQGEIDVVAAEQDVFAYRDALELQLTGLLGDSDQGEIGGAAADIDNEHQ